MYAVPDYIPGARNFHYNRRGPIFLQIGHTFHGCECSNTHMHTCIPYVVSTTWPPNSWIASARHRPFQNLKPYLALARTFVGF